MKLPKIKKAQGISINVIIVSAIALIVLIVLIAVFTGRIGIWGQDITKVTERSKCTDIPEDGGPSGVWRNACIQGQEREVFGAYEDSNLHAGESCCVKI